MTNPEQNLIWLASFPKSGNTWVRTFLFVLKNPRGKLKNINEISGGDEISSSKRMLSDQLGIDCSLLPTRTLLSLRSKAFLKFSEVLQTEAFIKTHEQPEFRGKQIIPKECTKHVLYIVRNPLDVAVSLAHHSGFSIERAVDFVNSSTYALNPPSSESWQNQTPQLVGSWSDHYFSWINAFASNITIIKYEDLLKDSFNTFKKIAILSAESVDEDQIRKAIKATSFNTLQSLESSHSFHEKPPGVKMFFREGKVGGYRKHLSKDQISRIIDKHGKALQELGYLDAYNNLTV